ncbi:hypothetical protein Tco_0688021 [Tanacetum coccineum]
MGILHKRMKVQNKLGSNNLVLGAQGDREAEDFHVSNDDTAVAQRWLEDKQPEEKTNMGCLVKEQEKEYQTGWKIKMGYVLDSCNQRPTQQCMKSVVAKHLGVARIQQQNGLVDETNVTLFAKVRCFLIQSGLSLSRSSAYYWDTVKSIVGNKLWRLDDVTSKVVLYRNMGFNKSGEYKKTFIGSGVGTSSMQVLQGDDWFTGSTNSGFDILSSARDREQHSCMGTIQYREDSNKAAFEVAAVDKIYAHKEKCLSDDGDGYFEESSPVGSRVSGWSAPRLDIALRMYGFYDNKDVLEAGSYDAVHVGFVNNSKARILTLFLRACGRRKYWLKGTLARCPGYETIV